MKLIKPMDGIEGVTASDAPGDQVSLWAPVGRDFVSGVSNAVLGCGTNLMFISEKFHNGAAKISKVDLATGEVFRDVITVEVDVAEIIRIDVSPDDAWVIVSIRRDTSTYESQFLYAYSTNLYDLKFSAQAYMSHRLSWLPDASGFVYLGGVESGSSAAMELSFISAGTWSKVGGAPFDLITGNNETYKTFTAGEIAVNDTSSAAFVVIKSGKRFSGSAPKSQFLAKVDLPSMTHSSLQLPDIEYTRTSRICAHNPYRNEVVAEVYNDRDSELRAFDDSTLSEKPLPITSPELISGLAFSPDSDEVIASTYSTSPKFRRMVASTYAESASLDSVFPFQAYAAKYSGDYYVMAPSSGGYALIDRTDDTLITQTNPAVTAGDIYQYQSNIYEALSDNSDRPDQGATGAESATWLDRGRINPLRMFDGKLDSTTVANDALNIEITPGILANGLALFNVTAATVNISMTDPVAGVVYDSGTIKMKDNSGVLGWHDYFFSPRPAKKDLARIDIPTYPKATINITLSAPGAGVAIGEIVLGRVQTLGETQYSTSVGIIDNSRKERDQFGNFNIKEVIERPFSKRAEYDVHLQRAATSGVQRILAGYRASPIVYIGNIEEEALIVYGFYRDFQINYENFSISAATITVEGL